MCGIAGIIGLNSNVSNEIIQRMTDSLRHRGPNAEGTFVEAKVALGQRRLSIIDLSTGANQPFFDILNRYVIVFNGEIYNYLELKRQIEYPWQTSSDTEVILAAYMKWGKDCLSYLNGMFAFAIWDRVTEELFVARDRLGVKPFYYYNEGGIFIFCSELRSILSTGLVEKAIDSCSLTSYLSSLAVKTPNSIIRNMSQLEPGAFAFYKNGRLTKEYYWRIDCPVKLNEGSNLSSEEVVQKTRHLFEDAVKSRMVADVPVGAFLSGGIDSSAIVALMSKFSCTAVETFSITFEDKRFDESKYAKRVANLYRTKHTELLLRPEDLIDQLPNYIADMDSPTVDGINSYVVSKLVASTGIKVALSGLGGDELFVGYKGFNYWKSLNKYGRVLNSQVSKALFLLVDQVLRNRSSMKIRNWNDNREGDLKAFYDISRGIFLSNEVSDVLRHTNNGGYSGWFDLQDQCVSSYPVYSQYTIAELTGYALDVLLKDTDQMSMASGLEVREPFFDYRLVEFVLSVPDEYKYSSKVPKSLLVQAIGDLLPAEIVHRPKKGFSFPWESWLRNELKEYCDSAIKKLGERDLFRREAILSLWYRFLKHDKQVKWMHIWSLVVLEGWLTVNDI